MAFFPFALQFLPLSGGTVIGPLVTAGITDSGGLTETGGAAISGGAGLGVTGALAVAGNITQSALGTLTTNGVDVNLAGGGLKVKEGANAKQGRTAALVAGVLTVANTSVTAASEIWLTGQTPGGTPGGLNVSARTAGTSFTITSTNAADTSTAGFLMNEPG